MSSAAPGAWSLMVLSSRSRRAARSRVASRGSGPARWSRLLDVTQMGVELVEPLGPDPPVLLDPGHGRVEGLPLEVAGPELGVPGPRDEPAAFEHLEVLGDPRKGHVEGRG